MNYTTHNFFPLPAWGDSTDLSDTSGLLAAYNAALEATDEYLWNLASRVWAETIWYPEFPGLVTTKRGATNTDGWWSTEWDATEGNYYEWTTDRVTEQQYSFSIMRQLPRTFAAWTWVAAFRLRYKTSDANFAHACIELRIYRNGTIIPACTQTAKASASWADITLDATPLGAWAGGDIITIMVTCKAVSSYVARFGRIGLGASYL